MAPSARGGSGRRNASQWTPWSLLEPSVSMHTCSLCFCQRRRPKRTLLANFEAEGSPRADQEIGDGGLVEIDNPIVRPVSGFDDACYGALVRSCAGFWTPATTRRSAGSTGRRPKSAKARSRGKCGTWQSNERYEGRMSAPLSTVSATRARDEVYLCIPGNRGECSGHLGGRVKCSNRRLVN